MRVYFYTPAGNELASAFAQLAIAGGHSCRTRDDSAFSGPNDCERADVVVVLPGRPATGLIAQEYFKREIAVVTACEGESAEQLLVRVIKQVITSVLTTNTEGFHELSGSGSADQGLEQVGPQPDVHEHRDAAAGERVTDQGRDSGRDAGRDEVAPGLSLDSIPVTSAPSVEETSNASHTRRNRQGRSK